MDEWMEGRMDDGCMFCLCRKIDKNRPVLHGKKFLALKRIDKYGKCNPVKPVLDTQEDS